MNNQTIHAVYRALTQLLADYARNGFAGEVAVAMVVSTKSMVDKLSPEEVAQLDHLCAEFIRHIRNIRGQLQ